MAAFPSHWHVLPDPPHGLAASLGLPPLWAALLHHRGVTERHHVKPFLEGGTDLLVDPFLLPGMDAAVSRLLQARRQAEVVGVFGDFDTDGVTATAILCEALEAAGVTTLPYIPHRVEEGHGLNVEALKAIREQGAGVVVTVDTGVTSIDEVVQAREWGLDVIVTDHHLPSDSLPPARAIVNPKLGDAAGPFHDLTGAGLAFKLAQALAMAREVPWDPTLLELAALGTVADMAPLQGENRYLVKQGIAQLRRSERPGIRALYDQAHVDAGRLGTEALSFALIPRLNAAGRIQHARTSLGLLLADTAEEAAELARTLEEQNRLRQQLTASHFDLALGLAEREAQAPLLLVAGEEFTPGIVGLVASRLVEQYGRPAVVVALDGEMGRGSARSIGPFNLAHALEGCADLLERHGGHSQAAGFVVERHRIDALRERLQGLALDQLGPELEVPALEIDARASPRALVGRTLEFLHAMEPFGRGNSTPAFLMEGAQVLDARTVGNGEQHLLLKVRDRGAVWNAIAFRQADRWVPGTTQVDLVYSIGIETWNGSDRLRLTVLDLLCR